MIRGEEIWLSRRFPSNFALVSDRATQVHRESPAIARRGGPSGSFADFDLIPLLLTRAKATGDRDATIKEWTNYLAEVGFESAHIEHDAPNTPLAPRVAADAWRFAERMELLDVDGITPTGEESASLAVEDMPRCLQALVPILAQGVERELRGRGGFDTLGLLREAVGKLAETTNLWARVIPGLLPIEIGAIVHWAPVEPSRAIDLVGNIESWRDVPMHKAGGPPDPKVPMAVHVERHFESVYEFYLEQPLACRANTLIVRRGTCACEAPCLVPDFQGVRPWRGGLLSHPNIKVKGNM